MEVFRIRLNSNSYQSFLPVDAGIWRSEVLKLDCKPKITKWTSPKLYIHNPKREKGTFFHFCSGGLVIDATGTEVLRTILEEAGELLPLTFEGKKYFLLNVLECVNCLDPDKSKWVIGKTTGARIRIEEYRFDRKRFSESTIFKIPETSTAEVLCVTGLKDSVDEFKSQVESLGLKGLIFEKLWAE